MKAMLVGLMIAQTASSFSPEPAHIEYLVMCPTMLCLMGGVATGLVGLAYAHANFSPNPEDPAYSFFRHMAVVTVMALSSAVGASLVAYPLGGFFDIPRQTSFTQTLLGGLAGGWIGTLLIPPSMLTRMEGKVLALVSASFFASVGAAVAYDWPYLKGAYTREENTPPPPQVRLHYRWTFP